MEIPALYIVQSSPDNSKLKGDKKIASSYVLLENSRYLTRINIIRWVLREFQGE